MTKASKVYFGFSVSSRGPVGRSLPAGRAEVLLDRPTPGDRLEVADRCRSLAQRIGQAERVGLVGQHLELHVGAVDPDVVEGRLEQVEVALLDALLGPAVGHRQHQGAAGTVGGGHPGERRHPHGVGHLRSQQLGR